jgi:hypothetical protein
MLLTDRNGDLPVARATGHRALAGEKRDTEEPDEDHDHDHRPIAANGGEDSMSTRFGLADELLG